MLIGLGEIDYGTEIHWGRPSRKLLSSRRVQSCTPQRNQHSDTKSNFLAVPHLPSLWTHQSLPSREPVFSGRCDGQQTCELADFYGHTDGLAGPSGSKRISPSPKKVWLFLSQPEIRARLASF